jgi:hypothetical protein
MAIDIAAGACKPMIHFPTLVFVVAATSVLPSVPTADSKKYAAWAATIGEEGFDAESTLQYLRSEKKDIDPELVMAYAIPNRPPISRLCRLAPA